MVVLLSAAALIAGILEVVTRPISKFVIAICIGVAVLGLITIIYHVYRLRRFDLARVWISRLLAEGQQLVLAVGKNLPGRFREFPSAQDEQYQLMADWRDRVESVLRKYLDESYITRLHLGGSNEQDVGYMTIWKMNHRLETLATFLRELKP